MLGPGHETAGGLLILNSYKGEIEYKGIILQGCTINGQHAAMTDVI